MDLAAALADATRRSPAELASMGARGMRVVSERFSWDTIALDFINCYEWMLGKGGNPRCMDKHDQRERDISEGVPEDLVGSSQNLCFENLFSNGIQGVIICNG